MRDEEPGAAAQPSDTGAIASWRDFEDRVGAAMAWAATQPCDIVMVDPDFARWPVGARGVMAAFEQWALLSRATHCTLVARDWTGFARAHPRWVAWRGLWAHRVRCLEAPEELASQLLPTLLVGRTMGLRVLEPLRGHGTWSRDPAALGAWAADVDAILQRSIEALPPTTLGL
jgi:hypothetical protein